VGLSCLESLIPTPLTIAVTRTISVMTAKMMTSSEIPMFMAGKGGKRFQALATFYVELIFGLCHSEMVRASA